MTDGGCRFLLGAALVLAALPSCQSTRAIRPEAVVVVKDIRIPETFPWPSRFARHTWLEYRESPGATWNRLEIPGEGSGIVHEELTDAEAAKTVRLGRRVRILAQNKENSAGGRNMGERLVEAAKKFDDSVYRPWPGPNSNTFAEEMLRQTEGASAVLDHNAVGKDFTFRVGPTAGGSGVEVEAFLLGAAVGLREGVEVNLLGFTAGVGFWPPVIRIPFLPEFPPRP